jgi:hypothetical protein
MRDYNKTSFAVLVNKSDSQIKQVQKNVKNHPRLPEQEEKKESDSVARNPISKAENRRRRRDHCE